jgi:hypothetical protein
MVFPGITVAGRTLALAFLIGAVPVAAEYSLVDKDEITRFFGTDRVKVVFVSEKKLYYADFSGASPTLKIIDAAQNPINPVISPDGGRVAYASGTMLVGDPPNKSASAAWICDLSQAATPAQVDSPAFVPRFIQGAAQQTLLYATSGCGNLAEGVHPWDGCGRMLKKNTVTNEKTVLWDKGAWYGGLSYDGCWLATAEGLDNAFLQNLSSPSAQPVHTLRVVKAASGKDTLLPFQTCNPSISSSRRFFDAVMYLDIGVGTFCANGYTVPGFGEDNGWDNHTRIFISRSDGRIVRYFRAPLSMTAAWAYPEWSNHPYFAAAALEVERYWSQLDDFYPCNEKLYAINLRDSAYLVMVRQTDTALANLQKQSIKWPWLWVETPDTFAQVEDTSWLDRSVKSVRPLCSMHGTSGRIGFKVANGLVRIEPGDIAEIRVVSLDGRILRRCAAGKGAVLSLRNLAGVCVIYCINKEGRVAAGLILNQR